MDIIGALSTRQALGFMQKGPLTENWGKNQRRTSSQHLRLRVYVLGHCAKSTSKTEKRGASIKIGAGQKGIPSGGLWGGIEFCSREGGWEGGTKGNLFLVRGRTLTVEGVRRDPTLKKNTKERRNSDTSALCIRLQNINARDPTVTTRVLEKGTPLETNKRNCRLEKKTDGPGWNAV